MKLLVCTVLAAAAPMLAQNCSSPPPVTQPAVTINCVPTREFGQTSLTTPPISPSPNLIEGRELWNPSGIAFDASGHVYIADTGNNRVLGFKNANNLSQGNFADLVIGQADVYSSFPLGPGTSLSTGLNAPTGLAVDASGNLYVADSGNNRILRFKTPFTQTPGNLPVDLVIGQKTTSSGNAPNQGLGAAVSATTLNLSSVGNPTNSLILQAGLAIDKSGTLWVADVGSNRVLGFPSSSLTANTSLPPASVVLGQNGFTSSAAPTNASQTSLGYLADPSGLAVDGQGNLFVADELGRVVEYLAPISSGQSGSKVLGVLPTPTPGQIPTYPTSSTLGSINVNNGINGSPQGVFILNGSQGVSVLVADTPQSRVVRYDTFSGNWTPGSNANSPVESGFIGQVSFGAGQVNQGQNNPSNATLSYPVAGAINPSNQEMWVVDQGNNRVVAFANQGGSNYSSVASRVVGQTDFIYGTANLIVGSEFWMGVEGGGVVVDSSSCTATQPVTCSKPPHLYIADTRNNRILGFNDARNVGVTSQGTLTQKADLVIGQPDLFHSTVNYPNGGAANCAAAQPSPTGLCQPVGLAVDSNGNLWVVDSGNSRAVRFPSPFSQPAGALQTATMVLGQADLLSANPNVNSFNMVQPVGIAIFAAGEVAISDASANRIMEFTRPAGGDFTMGQAASYVIGQATFNQASSGSGSNQLNSPFGLGVDSSDRLFVADYGNSRLLVFSTHTATNPSATLIVPNLYQIEGVAVSFPTGRSWVALRNSSVVEQFPEFDTLQGTQNPIQSVSSYGPLAVALDPFDNLIVATSANRLDFYFGQLYIKNTASYAAGIGAGSTAGPTPGMLTWAGLYGSNFSFTPSYGTGSPANLAPPWPATVSNVQVTVNGVVAPIFRVDPTVVLFEIPNATPSSGPANFVVTNPTTGQVLAAATFNMLSASPGMYTTNAGGTGQVAATTFDSKGNPVGTAPYANLPSNPVSAGGILTLWLTGSGYVSGLPADGTAPTGVYNTHAVPNVLINGEVAQVIGSVISPQFPGLWQVNVFVPADTPSSSLTGGSTSVIVFLDDHNSNIGGTNGTGGPGPDQKLLVNSGITTIYVK